MSLFEHEFKTLIPRTRLIESFERLTNPVIDPKWFEGILHTYNQTRTDREAPHNFEHSLDVSECRWQWHFEVRSDNGRKAEKELLPKRLKGIQEMGTLVFLREMSDVAFKSLIPWVTIYAGFLWGIE